MKKVYYHYLNYDTDIPSPVLDRDALAEAKRLLTEDELHTGNSFVLIAVRHLVKEKLIKHTDIEFYFLGSQVYKVDEKGDFDKEEIESIERVMLLDILDMHSKSND